MNKSEGVHISALQNKVDKETTLYISHKGLIEN